MNWLAIISLALDGAERIYRVVHELREVAKQSGEWTPEQEVAFRQKIDAMFKERHWQTGHKLPLP